jgi:hypothetical protein
MEHQLMDVGVMSEVEKRRRNGTADELIRRFPE